MPFQSTHELREFHRFVGEKLNNGGMDLSPEQALEEWRRLHPDESALAEDTAAIQEALDRNEGNRTQTARQLGISLRTLQYRLKQYFGEE